LEGAYSAIELAELHSLLPLYKPFIGDSKYESAMRVMEGSNGTGLKMGLGITASGLLKFAEFRFCERCVRDDVLVHGVPYWHIIHSAAGVCVCPHHGCVLRSAHFPTYIDWRGMFLPGETPSSPVLNDVDLESARIVAEMQWWGLSNPQRVTQLLQSDILRTRLSELGLLHKGRLRVERIKAFVNSRFRSCTHSAEYSAVCQGSDWVLGVLYGRARIVQPFYYYFLLWVLGMTSLDLESYIYSTAQRVRSTVNSKGDRKPLPSSVELAARRADFMSEGSIRCHDKAGYSWLYRNDRDWLRRYIDSHKYIRPLRLRVDWNARDDCLLYTVASVHKNLLVSKGKPIKITCAALIRGSSIGAEFSRKPHKFPKTSKYMKCSVETEHDYQLRKVNWAVRQLPPSQRTFISVILRVAGIRVRHISELEIQQVIGC